MLERASAEMLDYAGTGMSVMEMSHRSKAFVDIAERAEADLIELLGVPDDYKVLFLQGGATTQFAMVPMNLLNGAVRADYVNTGSWSKKAIKEAGRYCDVNVAASSEETGFDRVPPSGRLGLVAGCRLSASLLQRDHRRRATQRAANRRQLPDRGGHVVGYPVPSGQRE